MFRIDCHFHPNFSFRSKEAIKKKSLKIWDKFKTHKLDIVICTEHNFKKPKESFLELIKYKPKNHKTLLLPGVEATTKEGIDILLFSDRPNFYDQNQDLLIPNFYSLDLFIQRLKKSKDVLSIIAHPNIIFQQGLLSNLGVKKYKQKFREFDFVEKHNACLNEMIELLKTFKNSQFYRKLKSVKSLPQKYIHKQNFLVGSDAHHLSDIGTCLEFPFLKEKITFHEIKNLINSKEKRQIKFIDSKHKVLNLSKKIYTSVMETFQAKFYQHKINNLTLSKWQTEYMLKESRSIWKNSKVLRQSS